MSRKQTTRHLCPVCGAVSRHRYCALHQPHGWRKPEHRDKYAGKSETKLVDR